MTRLVFLVAALAACTSAWADASPARGEILQKERFVRRLLEAARPPLPADAPAAALHARALEHAQRGEYKEADARLNESIRSLQSARRQAAAASPREDVQAQLARRLADVELMVETYRRHAGATGATGDATLARAEMRLAQARASHAARRSLEAAQALQEAEQSMTHALTHLLGSVTLNYAPRFSGADEEFRHEQQRNRAYAALVPAALNELRPAGAALMLVQRYVESGEAMAALAARQAEQGNWRAALDSVRNATAYLQRGLGAAGLAVPQGITE